MRFTWSGQRSISCIWLVLFVRIIRGNGGLSSRKQGIGQTFVLPQYDGDDDDDDDGDDDDNDNDGDSGHNGDAYCCSRDNADDTDDSQYPF